MSDLSIFPKIKERLFPSRPTHLMLVTVCSPLAGEMDRFVQEVNLAVHANIQSVLFIVGKERLRHLAQQLPKQVRLFPYDRNWIDRVNKLVRESNAKWVALNQERSLNLKTLSTLVKAGASKKEAVMIAWPEYQDKNLDMHHWRYQVPRAPSVCFMFNRSFVNECGGFNVHYPQVAHWDMMFRLVSRSGGIHICDKSFIQDPLKYVPGRDEDERLHFLLQGALMLKDHGEPGLGPTNLLMFQYNLYEHFYSGKKNLKWLNNGGVGPHLLEAASGMIFGFKAWAPWYESNGIEEYPDINQEKLKSLDPPKIEKKVEGAYPGWAKPLGGLVKGYFVDRARKNMDSMPKGPALGTPSEVSPIYPGWARKIASSVKKFQLRKPFKPSNGSSGEKNEPAGKTKDKAARIAEEISPPSEKKKNEIFLKAIDLNHLGGRFRDYQELVDPPWLRRVKSLGTLLAQAGQDVKASWEDFWQEVDSNLIVYCPNLRFGWVRGRARLAFHISYFFQRIRWYRIRTQKGALRGIRFGLAQTRRGGRKGVAYYRAHRLKRYKSRFLKEKVEVWGIYPSWIRSFAARIKYYYLDQAMAEANRGERSSVIGYPIEKSNIYPEWIKTLGIKIKFHYYYPYKERFQTSIKAVNHPYPLSRREFDTIK